MTIEQLDNSAIQGQSTQKIIDHLDSVIHLGEFTEDQIQLITQYEQLVSSHLFLVGGMMEILDDDQFRNLSDSELFCTVDPSDEILVQFFEENIPVWIYTYIGLKYATNEQTKESIMEDFDEYVGNNQVNLEPSWPVNFLDSLVHPQERSIPDPE